MNGGVGDDTFEFDLGGGADRFIGFTAGAATEDTIELTGFGTAFDTFGEVIAAATQSDADTVIDFGGGDSLRWKTSLLPRFMQMIFCLGRRLARLAEIAVA